MDAMKGNPAVTLVISDLRMGGSQSVISRIANDLAGEGCEVHVLTLASSHEPFYPLHDTVVVTNLGVSGNSTSLLHALTNNFRRVLALRRALPMRSAVVLAFGDKTNIVTLLASRGTGIPVVVSERSTPFLYPLGWSWKILRRLLYPRAASVVVLNERCGEFFPWLRSTLRVIPNPVNAGQLTGDNVREPVILAVGRLVRLKGYDLLVRAFHRIHKDIPEWNVHIVGEGEARVELEALIRELGLEGRVFLKGETRDPHGAMSRASVFALPSRIEAFPNALCEAMACGMAVVAADCKTGPREIITNGSDGVLVPPEDVEALAASLLDLARDPAKRRAFGDAATQVAQRYAPAKVFAQWRDTLSEAAPIMGAPRGKKILVVIPSLSRGGAERVVSRLTLEWEKENRVTIAVFNGDSRAYPHGGRLVDLQAFAPRGFLRKAIAAFRRI